MHSLPRRARRPPSPAVHRQSQPSHSDSDSDSTPLSHRTDENEDEEQKEEREEEEDDDEDYSQESEQPSTEHELVSDDEHVIRAHVMRCVFGHVQLTATTLLGVSSSTQREQRQVEARIGQLLSELLQRHDVQRLLRAITPSASLPLTQPLALPLPLTAFIPFTRALHRAYLARAIERLPAGYTSLDSSRPWLIYWCVHAMTLMEEPGSSQSLSRSIGARSIDLLKHCQHTEGGFAGSPLHQAHLAPTYAAVLALCTIAHAHADLRDAALALVDRSALVRFLLRMKRDDGSFAVTEQGECDTRGVYTALVVASLCGLLADPALRARLTSGTAAWIVSCQTFEGGLGGEPGNEAHAGYTYCALAASVLLCSTHLLQRASLLHWTVHRQMSHEGGFSGRTNKLVDGCYTFWVAALIPLLQCVQPFPSSAVSSHDAPFAALPALMLPSRLLDTTAVQRYVLLACQEPSGGLRDKPGKHPDLYHTCYCLSGLSIVQAMEEAASVMLSSTPSSAPDMPTASSSSHPASLHATNPVYNIKQEAVVSALAWYATHIYLHPDDIL